MPRHRRVTFGGIARVYSYDTVVAFPPAAEATGVQFGDTPNPAALKHLPPRFGSRSKQDAYVLVSFARTNVLATRRGDRRALLFTPGR